MEHQRGFLECSYKVTPWRTLSNRFIFWFMKPQQRESIRQALDFLRLIENEAGLPLNDSLFRKIYDDTFDLSRVRALSTGVDFREEAGESRVKLWFIPDRYPEKTKAALKLCENAGELRKWLFHEELLVGFDFYFDGRSVLKIYPEITRREFLRTSIRQKVQRILPARTMELLEQCNRLHVCFSRHEKDRVLHFHGNDLDVFFRKFLAGETADRIRTHFRQVTTIGGTISFLEQEMLAGQARNWNFYYIPSLAI